MDIKREIRNVLAAGCVLATSFAGSLNAQEVYSQIVGAIAIPLPAESDVIVSTPFRSSTAYKGSVLSSSVENGNVLQVNVEGTPFTSGQFYDVPANSEFVSHYIHFETGNLSGRIAAISGNGTSFVSITGDNDLSAVEAMIEPGDAFTISKAMNLESAFPAGVASVDDAEPGLREIELIVPKSVSIAGSMNAEAIFFFYDGKWRQFGQPLDGDAGKSLLAPNASFVIRNNGTAKTAYFFGEVSTAPISVELITDPDQDTDHFVGLGRPLDVPITELGLENHMTNADRLLVYSLSDAARNKTPQTEYSYNGSVWNNETTNTAVDIQNPPVIETNMGFAVRKAAAPASTQIWINEWSLPSQ